MSKQMEIAKQLYERMSLAQLEETRANLLEGLQLLDSIIQERQAAE